MQTFKEYLLLEFVVPMGFSLESWKKYKDEHNISNKEYHQENPDKKWKVVHGKKVGLIGEPLPGLDNVSYNKASRAHKAIVISQG